MAKGLLPAVAVGIWFLAVLLALRIDASFPISRGGRALILASLLFPAVALLISRRVPRRPSRAVLLMGLSSFLLVAVSAFSLPAGAENLRRVFAPWSRAPAQTPAFRIVVPHSEQTLSRGESLTLSAYLTRETPDAVLPSEAQWHVTSTTNETTVTPVISDESAVFTLTIPRLEQGFRYQLIAGAVQSEPRVVRVVETVSLLAQTSTQLIPPEYASATWPPQTLTGVPSAVRVLRGGAVQVHLAFDRRPTGLRAEWMPSQGDAVNLPVTMKSQEIAAEVVAVIGESGIIRISTTDAVPQSWSMQVEVIEDLAPVVNWVRGLTGKSREAKPMERLPVDFSLSDDVGLREVFWEYQHDGEPKPTAVPFALGKLGVKNFQGFTTLPLAGIAREGELLRVRLVVLDNAVPSPHRVTFPMTGWVEFRITSSAKPSWEQEVLERQTLLQSWLDAGASDLRKCDEELQALRKTVSENLSFDERLRLTRATENLRELLTLPGKLTVTAQATVELQKLATLSQAVVGKPLTVLLEPLETALKTTEKTDWPRTLRVAEGTLQKIRQAWPQLSVALTTATEDRLAVQQLRLLAAELRAQPMLAPDAVRSQLAGLIGTHETLRRAVAAEAQDRLHRQVQASENWLRDFRKLDDLMQKSSSAIQAQRLQQVGVVWQELLTTWKELQASTRSLARIQGLPELPNAATETITELIRENRTLDALTALQGLGAELDRNQVRYRESQLLRRDPREALVQFHRMLQDIKRDFQDSPRTPATLERCRRNASELRDLLREIAPAKSADETCEKLQEIVVALTLSNRDVAAVFDAALASSQRLLDQTPTLPTRLLTSRMAYDQWLRDCDQWSRDFDDVSRQANANYTLLLSRWRTLQSTWAKFDLPGFEGRKAAILRIMQTVEDDVSSGHIRDAKISQKHFRRACEWLAEDWAGRVPTDDAVRQLALDQRLLLDRFANGETSEKLAEDQRQLARRCNELPASRYAGLIFPLVERMRTAAKPTQGLVDAANQLARAMTGEETDLERLERLSQEWAKYSAQDTAADWPRRIRLTLEELDETRFATLQANRQNVVDAMQLFRAKPDAARLVVVQQALQKSTLTMPATVTFFGPPPPTEADRLIAHAAGGRWVETRVLDSLTDLSAKLQRLRDQLSQAVSDTARWPKPLAHDDYAKLAARVPKSSETTALKEALVTGDATGAIEQMQALRQAPGLNPVTDLTEPLSQLSRNPQAALTRQRAHLQTLRQDYQRLKQAWPEIVTRQPPDGVWQDVTSLWERVEDRVQIALEETQAGRVRASESARQEVLLAAVKLTQKLKPLTKPWSGREEDVIIGMGLIQAQRDLVDIAKKLEAVAATILP
jgi:hypothetical protein